MWAPALAAIIAVPCMCVQYFTPHSNISLLAGYAPDLQSIFDSN